LIKFKSKRRPPAPPLSAMSDIGFLLLIFIMLLSLINYRKEVKIEYPEASQIEKTETEHQLEIWIDKEGAIIVDGQTMTKDGLENIITDSYIQHPDTRIQIIADRRTPYRNIDQVVKILQILQHRIVSFVVREDL